MTATATRSELVVLRDALRRCREAATVDQVLERLRDVLEADLGFGHVVVGALTDGTFTPLTSTAGTDLLPLVLDLDRPEAEIVRLRRPALVPGRSPLVAGDAWIGAPIVTDAGVVGLVVVSRGDDDPLIQDDCERVGLLVEGASCAVERAGLLEHSRANVRAAWAFAAQLEASFDEPAPVTLARGRSPAVPRRVGPVAARAADHRLAGLLTAREREVMELMADGARNAQIAARLVITEGTVKSHIKQIFRKLRVANRAEAVAKYLRLASV